MYFATKEKAIEAVTKAVPFAYQITDWDISSKPDAIEFTWRKNNRFHVELGSGSVSECRAEQLSQSDIAILMGTLIKRIDFHR